MTSRGQSLPILIIGGGWSEREINRRTVANILGHLDPVRYKVSVLELTSRTLSQVLNFRKFFPRVKMVLLAIAGEFVEDGHLQAILESQGVLYSGSDSAASALAFDKAKASLAARGLGLWVPEYVVWPQGATLRQLRLPIFPLFAKPVAGGSSQGALKLTRPADLHRLQRLRQQSRKDYIVSKFINGVELTCPVLAGKALPVVQIIPSKGKFFDYSAKYFDKTTQEICPAVISPALTRLVQKQAEIVHLGFGCRGLTRSDFIYEPRSRRLYFLEVNTLPGLTAVSLAPKAAAAAGISLSQLLDLIITDALDG